DARAGAAVLEHRLGRGHRDGSRPGNVRALVAGVAPPVTVGVRLVSVGGEDAVVGRTGLRRESRDAEAVAVRIGARVAGIAEAIEIRVVLAGVEDRGAVVAAG